MTAPSLPSMNVWPALGTTVTLASGYVITAAGAIAERTDEIVNLLDTSKLCDFDPTAVNPNPSPIPPVTGEGASVTVATSALLSATLGPTSGILGTTQGSISSNDTGGGQFYFDAGSTDTPDGALVLSGTGGRWKRIIHNNILNVRWFGAVGDGVADDTAAIQAAINACAPNAGVVFLPKGTYRITDSLRCGWTYGPEVFGITIRGESGTPRNFDPATRVVWDSAVTNRPAFWFNGYNFRFEGFGVYAAAGRALDTAFELGNMTASYHFSSSGHWENITVRGDTISGNGTVSYGVTFGHYHPFVFNTENCTFTGCYFFTMQHSCINIANGQPYNTSIDRCYFHGGGSIPTGYGLFVGGTNGTGSVDIRSTDCQNLEVAYYLFLQPFTFVAYAGEYEHCKKILFSTFGASSTINQVAIHNARVNNNDAGTATANFSAADRDMFVCVTGAALTLQGIVMDDYTNPVYVNVNYGATLVSMNNLWGPVDPFKVTDIAGGGGARCGGVWSTGDRIMNSPPVLGAQSYPLASRFGGVNVPGTATITGAATSVAVVLPSTEWVDDYRVRLDVESVTGVPAAGSFAPYVTALTATGFTINVPTAPGGVAAVTFRYTTWR